MFQNLTKREKILASATGGTLGIALIFGAFFWFLGSYNANEATLHRVQNQIESEDARMRQAMAATRRKSWYTATSLSADNDRAKNEYIAWLKKTLRDDIGVELKGVDPERTTSLSHEGVKVADQISFSIRPNMTLSQLTEFLHAFYSMDALHRITTFKLTPQTATVSQKKIRTGMLKTSFQIQILSLTSAGRRSNFGKNFRDAGITIDQAEETIVRRDVFGPANNSPVLKARVRSSYVSGKSVSLKLTATDADEDDQVKIELLKSAVESAQFTTDQDRSATLDIPGQPAGSYTFTFKVTDDGLPERSTEEKVTVRFKDAVVKVVEPEPEPEPIEYAQETRITGNLRNREGQWIVLVKSQMDGKSWRLALGDSFELDRKTWEVKKINATSATFSVAGKALTFSRGQSFDQPDQ